MSLFNSNSYPVKRFSQGAYVKGRWVPNANGGPTEFTIQGTAQPAAGGKVQALMEGKRFTQVYELISSTNLNESNPELGVTGDQVYINGTWCEVINSDPCENKIIPHFEMLCIVMKEDPK